MNKMDAESKQYEVLYRVAKILNDNKIDYQISSSGAGKFYGLSRKPGDIDIDIFAKDVEAVLSLFGTFVTVPLSRCTDDFYDIDVIECLIDGEMVEFIIMDNGFYISHLTGERMECARFFTPVKKKLKDIEVKVQSIESIIGYKQHNLNKEKAANQAEDVRELKEILEKMKENT